jgi:hypothetical protein
LTILTSNSSEKGNNKRRAVNEEEMGVEPCMYTTMAVMGVTRYCQSTSRGGPIGKELWGRESRPVAKPRQSAMRVVE